MNDFDRKTMYKRSFERLRINWIGMELSPPLLLGLQEHRDQENECKEWANIEKNEGFHP